MYGDVPMSKVRVKNLTLGQVVAIAEEYNGSCGRCPLFNSALHCFEICDASSKRREQIKNSIRGFVDLEENNIIKEDD
jgi:hypothetical protein